MKAIILVVLAGALPGIALAQPASFEVQGLPLSLHQAQVTGLPDAREQAPAPTMTEYGNFPVSAAQRLVLIPRAVAHPGDFVVTGLDSDIGGGSASLAPLSNH